MRIAPIVYALALSCGAPAIVTPDAGLTALVSVAPGEAAAGDTVTVIVRIVNAGATPVTLQFRNTCIVTYEVRNAAGQVATPFIMCGQAITDHTFPAGTSERTFTFVVGSPEATLGPGVYEVIGGLGHPLILESEPVALSIGLGIN